MSGEERQRLHRHLQTAFSSNQDHSLVLARLFPGNGTPNRGRGGISDTAIDSLGPLPATLGKIGAEEANLRCAGLGDDEVAGS